MYILHTLYGQTEAERGSGVREGEGKIKGIRRDKRSTFLIAFVLNLKIKRDFRNKRNIYIYYMLQTLAR